MLDAMMAYPFEYDRQASLESLLFIARRVTEPTLHSVFKVLYFADKHHLERYGRLISGDTYIAMKYGPVPSHTYNQVKKVRGDSPFVAEQYLLEAFDVKGQKELRPKRDANTFLLSESDIECLEWAICEYGDKSFDERLDLSHDDSWHAARGDDGANRPIDVEALTLGMKDRELLLDYVSEPLR